jgi:hypothetical protein
VSGYLDIVEIAPGEATPTMRCKVCHADLVVLADIGNAEELEAAQAILDQHLVDSPSCTPP